MPINIRNGIYIMLCNILYMKDDKIAFSILANFYWKQLRRYFKLKIER